MKKKEFVQLMDDYGINPFSLLVTVDEPCIWEGFHGIYEKDNKWIYYMADGKRHTFEKTFDNEDEAFDLLLKELDVDLERFTNKYITKDIIKIPKSEIYELMKKNCRFTKRNTDNTWDCLKQDMRLFFEFKYYAATKRLILNEQAYKIRGYSAFDIFKTAHINIPAAFHCLMYLKTHPEEKLSETKFWRPMERKNYEER